MCSSEFRNRGRFSENIIFDCEAAMNCLNRMCKSKTGFNGFIQELNLKPFGFTLFCHYQVF
jgi:hypothetical protein